MENTHLIVGLGNPGSEYVRTRHNAGFMAVERLAEEARAVWRNEQKFQSRLARTDFRGVPLLVCEPLTYMNVSGVAVESVVRFYKLELSRVLVIVDDADLPLGTIRLRMGGSPGGHHGLESVERHLGTRDYARLRIGIGRRVPQVREITNHVLGVFGPDEFGVLQTVLRRVVDQVECWLTKGIQKAMNEFNGAINAPLAKDQ